MADKRIVSKAAKKLLKQEGCSRKLVGRKNLKRLRSLLTKELIKMNGVN